MSIAPRFRSPSPLCVAIAALWLGLAAAPAVSGAQIVVRGLVRDLSTQRPVGRATVSIIDPHDSALRVTATNDSGRFQVSLAAAGLYAIDVRRLGYAELTTTVAQLNLGDTVTITLDLSLVSATLDTVMIKSRVDSGFLTHVTPGHVALAEHYKLGKGVFVSGWAMERSGKSMSEYIGEQAGVQLAAIKMPGVPVIPGANGEFLTSKIGPPCLYARIDHWAVLSMLIQYDAQSIDAALRVKNIMAVEFYRSLEEVPREWRQDAMVAELWTRSYTEGFTYVGSDRYTIGVSGQTMDPQRMIAMDTAYGGYVRGDTTSQTSGAHAGYAALPDPTAITGSCAFMQIWTTAAW